MKILHLIGAAKPGGAETFAVRLMAALHARQGVTQQVLCRKGWVANRLSAEGVPHTTAPFGGWWDAHTPFFTHRLTAQVAQGFKPDVVLAWMNRGVTFMPQGAMAKNYVRAARLGGFYDLKYYRGKVTDLIGNTPQITAYCVREGWPAAQVHHVTNFIPPAPEGWQQQRAAQRTAWGWNDTDIGLLLVGRLHAVKGIDTALQALATLPPHIKLALVGAGPEEAALRALTKTLGLEGRVVFAGWADNVGKPASAGDIWLAPSRHEPLGNTAIDAWVHGKPLIVSAVGGLDMLVENGVHGLKVPNENPAALAAAVQQLVADKKLQARVVQGGTARWLAEYSESKIVGDYLALFAKLAKAR